MQNESVDTKKNQRATPTLFSGLRFGLHKTPAAEKAIITPKKYTINRVKRLLEHKKCQDLILQCNQLLGFTEEQSDTYVIPLLQDFSEFVQNLPETRNSYFSNQGGMIEHALMRATAALSMCRAYFSAQPSHKNNHRMSAMETLWMYTLFSSGILNGIGKVFSDFVIELYDENGKHLDRWNPFEGSMLETKASSYDYDFEEGRHADLFSRRLSVLLAKELIPFKGFAWISSDKEVLSVWLSLLEDNQRDAGIFGPFIVRADALAINTYFDEKRIQREYANLDKIALDEVNDLEETKELDAEEKEHLKRITAAIEKEKLSLRESESNDFSINRETEPSEEKVLKTRAGLDFLQWLKSQIKALRLEFNEAIFYIPTGALFLPTILFEAFRKKNPHYQSTQEIIDSFNKLQLHLKGNQNTHLSTFVRQTNENNRIEGIVLANAQLVLPKTVGVRLSNGSTKTMSSTDLPHYAHLLEALQPAGKDRKSVV